MRKGQILNLKRDKVKLDDGLIFVEHTKSGKSRQISINGDLRELLLDCLTGNRSEYVFLNDEGKQYRKVDTAFANALKRAGIQNFRFHDLRHTFACHMVMAGNDLATLRQILGHSNIRTTMRYVHLSPVHMQEAMEILGSRISARILRQDSQFLDSSMKSSLSEKAKFVLKNQSNWRGTQVVRERSAKPLYVGSIPTRA